MSAEQVEILQLSFQYLSTAAVIFATLSVLFGNFLLRLSLAYYLCTHRYLSSLEHLYRMGDVQTAEQGIQTTSQSDHSDVIHVSAMQQLYANRDFIRLFVLCTHYVGRGVMFGQRRSIISVSTEFQPWPTPTTFVSK